MTTNMRVMAHILNVLPETSSAFYIKKEDNRPPSTNIWSVRSSGKTKQEFLDYLDSRIDKWKYLGLRPEAVSPAIATGKSKNIIEYTAFIKFPVGVDLGPVLPFLPMWPVTHEAGAEGLRVTRRVELRTTN